VTPPPDQPSFQPPPEGTIEEQLVRAARDLWSAVQDSGESYVTFMDRRRLSVRIERRDDGRFHVSWQEEDGSWTQYEGSFENPREAAFHGYQGPH
jgi:hypothetical protein